MKPIIGITPSLQPDEKQCYLWDAYVNGIVRAGGIPLILPCVSDPESLQRYAEIIDGLLLSGGADIEPIQYGDESLDGFEIESPMTPARDVFEVELIRALEVVNKPILGICRGHQMLNVAFGGELLLRGGRKRLTGHDAEGQDQRDDYKSFHTILLLKRFLTMPVRAVSNDVQVPLQDRTGQW